MYIDHNTNEKVRKAITQHVRYYENLLSAVKRRELKWYGHVTRTSGLSNIILQGTVLGKRRRGIQKKKSRENMAEWTRENISTTTRMTGGYSGARFTRASPHSHHPHINDYELRDRKRPDKRLHTIFVANTRQHSV